MSANHSLWQELSAAASADPFLAVASGIFLLAIAHTFLAPRLAALGDRAQGSRAALLHLLGEVEVVFGLWALVLFGVMIAWPGKGWQMACAYIETADYAAAAKGAAPGGSSRYLEPIFVFVIMAMAASRPVLSLAESLLGGAARLLGGSPAARWASILTFAPLLGSLITEPAAMTLAALLLAALFAEHAPSLRLRYASLGLLFVNISIGGTLTHFAAPPVVMVAARWGWTTPRMFEEFGLKAILAIVLSNTLYWLLFRREFAALAARPARPAPTAPAPIPAWVTAVHLALMVWSVAMLMGHHAALLVAGFLGFLAFTVATPQWQSPIRLRAPLLVAFFLASLVVHGGLQGWWISPLLVRLDPAGLFAGATFLTAFNDNAAITYLAAQVPALTDGSELAQALQHAVLAGAVTGGGLTVIANAPNPAGQSILAPSFEGGISPLRLALWAAVPTVIAGACLMLLPR
ncbi:MAG: putative Na+/H+ antiporter [Opitutales bacterium]